MRITRKAYEKARQVVAEAREQEKTVKIWEEALKRLGDIGNQELVAITVTDDGAVRTECELVRERSSAVGTPK